MDSGWAAWLVQEIKEHAAQKFANARKDDTEALKDARILYEAAQIVDSIIKANAK